MFSNYTPPKVITKRTLERSKRTVEPFVYMFGRETFVVHGVRWVPSPVRGVPGTWESYEVMRTKDISDVPQGLQRKARRVKRLAMVSYLRDIQHGRLKSNLKTGQTTS